MTASSHADPVDVQRRDGSPVAFCWRGRVYRVQGVLAHWLETGPWWQSASVRALLTTGIPSHHPATSPPDTAPTAGDPTDGKSQAAAGSGQPVIGQTRSATGQPGIGQAQSATGQTTSGAGQPDARRAQSAATGQSAAGQIEPGASAAATSPSGAATSQGQPAAPASTSAAQPAATASTRRENTGQGQDQREFWQVEAAAGRHGTPGVFELCADLTAETPTWSVTTVTDQPTPPDRDSP